MSPDSVENGVKPVHEIVVLPGGCAVDEIAQLQANIARASERDRERCDRSKAQRLVDLLVKDVLGESRRGLNTDFLGRFGSFVLKQLGNSTGTEIFPIVVGTDDRVGEVLFGVRFTVYQGSRIGVSVEIDGFDSKVDILCSSGKLNVLSKNLPAHESLGYDYDGSEVVAKTIFELIAAIAILTRSVVECSAKSDFCDAGKLYQMRSSGNDAVDPAVEDSIDVSIANMIVKKSSFDRGFVPYDPDGEAVFRASLISGETMDGTHADRILAMEKMVSSNAFWRMVIGSIDDVFNGRHVDEKVHLSADIDGVESVSCGDLVFVDIRRGRECKNLSGRLEMPGLVGDHSALLEFCISLPAGDGQNGSIAITNNQLPRPKLQAMPGSLKGVWERAIVSFQFYICKRYGVTFDVNFVNQGMSPDWLSTERILDDIDPDRHSRVAEAAVELAPVSTTEVKSGINSRPEGRGLGAVLRNFGDRLGRLFGGGRSGEKGAVVGPDVPACRDTVDHAGSDWGSKVVVLPDGVSQGSGESFVDFLGRCEERSGLRAVVEKSRGGK